MQAIADVGSGLCLGAVLVGSGCLLRARASRGWLLLLALSLLGLAVWSVTVAWSIRVPYDPRVVRLVLTCLCIALAPWLTVSLALGTRSVRTTLRRWAPLLVGQGWASAAAAAVMWRSGLDWITGIGDVPAAVLTRAGMLAVGMAAVPGGAALVVLAARFRSDIGTMPAVAAGVVGAVLAPLWVASMILWGGYVTIETFASAVALAAAASLVWAFGVARHLPVARPLAPSRALVYGAAALTLVLAYVIVARLAFNLVSPMTAAIPSVLPALAFTAAAGLIVVLGSRRSRHRLWVAVGRYLFASKHDYGAVWIELTRLVAEARDAKTLLDRAATFCRDILCVERVGIFLVDSGGGLRPAAGAGFGPGTSAARMLVTESGDATGSPALADGAPPGSGVLCAFVCPMQLGGQLLGYIAVGQPDERSALDEEDHRVVTYVAAQVASALALYRFAEEIADAREVASFNRVSAFIIHDLKNLVAQQSFVLENAERFRGNPAFVADALDAFTDSTRRMRSLVNRLRGSEPAPEMQDGPVDLIELVRELTSAPRLTLPGGCALQVTVPDGESACAVRADRGALTQVLTNLLVNAVESLPDDHGQIEVRLEPARGRWRVEVADNGRGIPEAFAREHLFRPFRTTKDSGLGIGLYQCKVLVESAGGTIDVRSQPGRGTTVSVSLPALLEPEAPAAAVLGQRDANKTNAPHH